MAEIEIYYTQSNNVRAKTTYDSVTTEGESTTTIVDMKSGLLTAFKGFRLEFFTRTSLGIASNYNQLAVSREAIRYSLLYNLPIDYAGGIKITHHKSNDRAIDRECGRADFKKSSDIFIIGQSVQEALIWVAGKVLGMQEEKMHHNIDLDEEVPKPKPAPPKPAPPKPEAPPVARATVRKGPGLGERISKGIVDHPGRVFIPMSLVGVMALALGVSEVGKITYEAGKTVVDHPILGWAIVSGIINSLIANAFEQKVYQRSGFENIKQVVFDSAKYSVLWGIIISNSELLQNFFNIYNTNIRSNNALVKIFQSLPEWSQSARDYAFLATFFTQNLLAIFTGKLKRPELLKKLGVEQFETIPEAMAVYFFPYLLPLNIVSMIYAGVKFAKRVAKQEGDKHR